MENFVHFGNVGKYKIFQAIKEKLKLNLLSKGYDDIECERICSEVFNYNLCILSDGLGRMSCGIDPRTKEKQIRINKLWWNEKGGKLFLKEHLKSLFEIILGHESLHALSNSNGINGIRNRYGGKKALNEGITQMIAEDAFGYVVSPNSDRYKDFKKIAKIFRETFGDKIVCDSYFYHSSDLRDYVNKLANNPSYYALLNQDLSYVETAIGYGLSELKDSLMDDIYRDIVINIIRHKLESLTKSERTDYLNRIRAGLKDDAHVDNIIALATGNIIYTNRDKIRENIENKKLLIDKLVTINKGLKDVEDVVEIQKDSNGNNVRFSLKEMPSISILGESIKTLTLYKAFLSRSYQGETKKVLIQN